MTYLDNFRKITTLPLIVKLAILYLLWFLLHLPGVVNFYYWFDDALYYLIAPASDLKANINIQFPQGRFLLPFYYYLFSLFGINLYVSNAPTLISGIFTCLTGLLLMHCMEKYYGMRNSIAVIIPCLYVIVSPLFIEVQYLRVATSYPLAMLLSTLAYIAFCQRKLLTSIALNLSVLMLSQSSGMLFYVLFLIGSIVSIVKSERTESSLIKRIIEDFIPALMSIAAYIVIFAISRVVLPNQNENRGIAQVLDLSFLLSKLNLIQQLLIRFTTAGSYSSSLVSLCIAVLLISSIVYLYVTTISHAQQKFSQNIYPQLLLVTFCLILLLPVASFPLLLVRENWPSFRVSLVMATGCIIICVLPLGWLNPNSSYSKGVSIFLLFYLCLLSVNTLDIGNQHILIFQKDREIIAKLQELNYSHNINSAEVIASEITNKNPYFIPNFVTPNGSDLLVSSLHPLWSLDAFLQINNVGKLVDVSEKERERLIKQYCRPEIRQMTPVMSSEGITVLCR